MPKCDFYNQNILWLMNEKEWVPTLPNESGFPLWELKSRLVLNVLDKISKGKKASNGNFNMSLERSWSLNIENVLMLPIWVCVA